MHIYYTCIYTNMYKFKTKVVIILSHYSKYFCFIFNDLFVSITLCVCKQYMLLTTEPHLQPLITLLKY